MLQIPKLLSKTKILLGYQCHKNIYLAVHKKNLIPPVTPELQALFDQGNEVTIEARKRFPQGVLVDNPAFDFVGSLKRTRQLLAAHTEHIFEAAFEYKGCYARADVIKYNPQTQRWSVIEVKSTTKVKDEHLDDVGLQVWIMANAGLPIEKISVMHLNNLCKHPRLDNLFIEEDVTDKLRDLHVRISPRMTEIFKSLKAEEVPDIDIGPHCMKPRQCQFFDLCIEEKKIPSPSAFDIPRIGDKKWELYKNGQHTLTKIPSEALTEAQLRCLEVLKSGKPYIDTKKIKESISEWKFPLIFLDFETLNPAIPRYKGTGPFAQVPFQFSLHVLKDLNSKPEHFEYLHTEGDDPRSALIEKLIQFCPQEGSVVAYYAQFESARIEELEDFAPQFKDQLKQIRERLVDPLPIIRESVYVADFGDSYSIKSVGPALLGKNFSYDEMSVGDGGAAQRAYVELIAPGTNPERKNLLKKALIEYCFKDTLVMVELVNWLFKLS